MVVVRSGIGHTPDWQIRQQSSIIEDCSGSVTFGVWSSSPNVVALSATGTAQIRTWAASSTVTCSWSVGAAILHPPGRLWASTASGYWSTVLDLPPLRSSFRIDAACPIQTSGFLPPHLDGDGMAIRTISSTQGSVAWYGTPPATLGYSGSTGQRSSYSGPMGCETLVHRNKWSSGYLTGAASSATRVP